MAHSVPMFLFALTIGEPGSWWVLQPPGAGKYNPGCSWWVGLGWFVVCHKALFIPCLGSLLCSHPRLPLASQVYSGCL